MTAWESPYDGVEISLTLELLSLLPPLSVHIDRFYEPAASGWASGVSP